MLLDHELLTKINHYLIELFNQVLIIEEASLQKSDFADLSVREMHTIEAIGLFGNTTSEIARKLRVTAGTVSVAVRNLVKKGYVERQRLEGDRRVVSLVLTERGKLLYRSHSKFHSNMVERAIEGMNEVEAEALIKGLENLYAFLQEINLNQRENGK